jgi:hypothetical protein
MQCSNPNCCFDTPYLRDGSLHLLDLETPLAPTWVRPENGFPVRSSPRKFFWLCVDCARQFTIRKWTESGVVLAIRNPIARTVEADSAISQEAQPTKLLLNAARHLSAYRHSTMWSSEN